MTYDPKIQVQYLRDEITKLRNTVEGVQGVLPVTDEMVEQVEEALVTLTSVADDVDTGVIIDPVRCQQILYEAIQELDEIRDDLDMIVERLS